MTTTLTKAVRAAIQHGNTLANIRADKWAETYHVDTETVRIAWEAELSRISLLPDNMYDGDGK